MRHMHAMGWVLAVSAAAAAGGQTVRLKATADVNLCSQVYQNKDERLTSMGLSKRFKLKSVQEMAAIRFDAAPAAGREVLSARLFLRRLPGQDMLRHVRVSTVSQDWQEGKQATDYGPADGACYLYADFNSKRPWAWPGSGFADVVMTSGNSLTTVAVCRKLDDGWVSVDLTPELVYALVAGDTDGLAVCDGGNLAFHNNFIHSVQAGAENAPYIEVELGQPLKDAPPEPKFQAAAGPEKARTDSGAIRLSFAPAPGAFCWKLALDGKPVDRWRVRHPQKDAPTVFFLEDLQPGKEYQLQVVAVAAGGAASKPVTVKVAASKALPAPPVLGELAKPGAGKDPPTRPGKLAVWALPGLIKVSPEKPQVLYGGVEPDADVRRSNAVWDGAKVGLCGARGEYVSFQLCVENLSDQPLKGVKVAPSDLAGPGGAKIGGADVELFRNWYAQNSRRQWQPAYCVPIAGGQAFDIPDPVRKLPAQQNQTLYVDVYVPKDARPGDYTGSVTVQAGGIEAITIPVELTVFDFVLPDKLSFWPQINSYSIPKNFHAYFRLAHQHRSVYYYRALAPDLKGAGKDIQVVWDRYDSIYGPLLSGEAFKDCRRAGVPIETAALPFADSWPTPLTTETYKYTGTWPKRGDPADGLNEHYMTCPPIEQALSRQYQEAFLAVEKQFIERFHQKGWNSTEMQCVFVGKNTHRTQFGINMWWTTDEPYHWVDWRALQFFNELWRQGRGEAPARQWAARADISRPQWQGLLLKDGIDNVYYGTGCWGSEGEVRRLEWLAEASGVEVRAYGSANNDSAGNLGSLVWIVNTWLNGGSAALPWQGLGSDAALDAGDPPGGGNALICPGDRFGLEVVADLRLKAFRDAEQLVEYLNLLQQRRGLSRLQVRQLVRSAVAMGAQAREGAAADNADAMVFTAPKDWQLAALRRQLAKLITEGR